MSWQLNLRGRNSLEVGGRRSMQVDRRFPTEAPKLKVPSVGFATTFAIS